MAMRLGPLEGKAHVLQDSLRRVPPPPVYFSVLDYQLYKCQLSSIYDSFFYFCNGCLIIKTIFIM